MKRYTLLTGATGLIGSYVLSDLMSQKVPTVALVRGENPEQRLDGVIKRLEAMTQRRSALSWAEPPEVISGDLTKSDLGIAANDLAWIAENVESVIHSGGDVSFHGQESGEGTWRTNVDGARHLIDLCKSVGVTRFSYVSTSFVCGNRQGVIREDELDCGQGFCSTYEKSKFEAERLLHQAGFEQLNVLRPCSVTGDSSTGYVSSFHGVYWFVQITDVVRRLSGAAHGERWKNDVRLFRTGKERHHLLPVDVCSRAIVELHQRKERGSATFHLTPPHSTTLAELEAALADYFQYSGVRFVPPGSECNLNSVERMFYEGLSGLDARYLDSDPTFDCSATQACLSWWKEIEVSHDYLLKIFDFACQQQFGRKNRRRDRTEKCAS